MDITIRLPSSVEGSPRTLEITKMEEGLSEEVLLVIKTFNDVEAICVLSQDLKDALNKIG